VVLVTLMACAVLALRWPLAQPGSPAEANAFMAGLADEAVQRARSEFGVALEFPDTIGGKGTLR
jgi:hypothetical protein